MGLRTWLGLLILLAWIGGSYLRVRARRRSGEVSSFGHPVLDNLLLLTSALVLVGLLFLAHFLALDGQNSSDPIRRRLIFYAVLLAFGAALTWLCNRLLRR